MFRDGRSWLLHLYDRTLRLRSRWPLPGRGRIVRVRAVKIAGELSLRLGGSDFAVLHEICGERSREYDAVQSLNLGPAPAIVDLGANVGLTVRLWRTWFPTARILAVEPDPDNVKMIRRNVPEARALGEGDSVVQIAPVCVAAAAGDVALDRSELPWAFSMRSDASPEAEDRSAIRVPADTMETLLEQWTIRAPIDLLKCDIEGAERELFEACEPWIGRVRRFVVETHGDWGEADLAAALRHARADFRLTTLRKLSDNRLILGESVRGAGLN